MRGFSKSPLHFNSYFTREESVRYLFVFNLDSCTIYLALTRLAPRERRTICKRTSFDLRLDCLYCLCTRGCLADAVYRSRREGKIPLSAICQISCSRRKKRQFYLSARPTIWHRSLTYRLGHHLPTLIPGMSPNCAARLPNFRC